MINNVNYQQQQLQAQQAQAQQVQQQVQEQTQQLNDISQYGDISVFNQDNPYKGDEIQFSDLQDRIEAANKFFAENKPDANGLYSADALKMMSDICVIMDENGTILTQLSDQDGDGKVDNIEYYSEKEDGGAVHKIDSNADGQINQEQEYFANENGVTQFMNEYTYNEDGEKELTSTTLYDDNGQKTTVTTEEKKITYTYEYDENGNPIAEITNIDLDGDGIVDKKEKSDKLEHYNKG